MGVWGPGLYDNDCTSDIRDEFQHLLSQGVHPRVISTQIREEFDAMFCDEEDGPLVELALNEQMFQAGAITKKDLIKTISYLNNGGDLDRWKMERSELVEEREKEIARLKMLFLSPMPKVIKKKETCISMKINWCEGQVFAIPIEGEKAGDLQGEYFLLHICGEEEKNGRYRTPKMRVKITKGKKLPQNANDFNALEYVQISCTAMKDRLLPFYREDAVPQEFRQDYCPDEWGYLPEYTLIAYEFAHIHPPETMIYLGKWDNILPPSYDFKRYPFPEGVAWHFFQDIVIHRYRLYNLRQAQFYSKR